MGKILTARKAGGPDFTLIVTPKLDHVRSNKDVHFTEELAKNESEQENLAGLISNKILIHNVAISAAQALKFRLEFYSRDTFTDPDLDVDTFIGAVELDLSKYGTEMEVG